MISNVFIRYIWPKMSLKKAQTGLKSSPNFNIELRTSRTWLPSPKVELNKLEHPKIAELRTRTQVHSNNTSNHSDKCLLIFTGLFVRMRAIKPQLWITTEDKKSQCTKNEKIMQ